MAFGLQRWIYTQKTRKLFAHRTKPDAGGAKHNYNRIDELLSSNAKYKKLIDSKKLTPEYKELLLENLANDKKVYRQKVLIMILLTLLIIVPVAYFFYDLNKPLKKSRTRQITKEILTPNGKIRTAIIFSSDHELFAIEQYLNDSLILKEKVFSSDTASVNN